MISNILIQNQFICVLRYIVMIDHCAWDDWIMGDCSVTCGGGTRTNTRTSKASAANGGVVCNEETISIDEACNVQPCPGTNFIGNLPS